MRTSETLSKIAPALLKAQGAITFASKDAANPFFKSKYANLPTVIDAVKPALNSAGIVFIQTASPSESGTLSLTTRLIHESGEWIEDTATAPLAKNDPQGYGSAITYLRRYSLAAITGLYQDDDDGQEAIYTPAQKPVKEQKEAVSPFVKFDEQIKALKKCGSLPELLNVWNELDKSAQYALASTKDACKANIEAAEKQVA